MLGADRLPPNRVAEVLAGFPARRLRLAGKGRIEPGADADLVLVDRAARDELSAEDLHQRHRVSPFIGRTLRAGGPARSSAGGRSSPTGDWSATRSAGW